MHRNDSNRSSPAHAGPSGMGTAADRAHRRTLYESQMLFVHAARSKKQSDEVQEWEFCKYDQQRRQRSADAPMPRFCSSSVGKTIGCIHAHHAVRSSIQPKVLAQCSSICMLVRILGQMSFATPNVVIESAPAERTNVTGLRRTPAPPKRMPLGSWSRRRRERSAAMTAAGGPFRDGNVSMSMGATGGAVRAPSLPRREHCHSYSTSCPCRAAEPAGGRNCRAQKNASPSGKKSTEGKLSSPHRLLEGEPEQEAQPASAA